MLITLCQLPTLRSGWTLPDGSNPVQQFECLGNLKAVLNPAEKCQPLMCDNYPFDASSWVSNQILKIFYLQHY